MGNIIVVGILFVVLGISIGSMVKARKKGTSHHCGGNCGGCSGCHR